MDVYGDMGVYDWNCMGNVYNDMSVGTEADLVIHRWHPPTRPPT